MAEGETTSPHKRNEIELRFGDGEYLFRFGLKQFAEHDEKCGPIGAVFARVLAGRLKVGDGTEEIGFATHAGYRHTDLRETVRLGLIGGGQGVVNDKPVRVTAVVALNLVERYFDGEPLEEGWKLAAAILTVVCQGYEDRKFKPVLPGESEEEESGEAAPRKGRGGKRRGTAGDSTTPPS